jgi:hypothetical protein
MNRARRKLSEKIERNIQRLKRFDKGEYVRVKTWNITGTIISISSHTHISDPNSTTLLYLVKPDGREEMWGFEEDELVRIERKEKVGFT